MEIEDRKYWKVATKQLLVLVLIRIRNNGGGASNEPLIKSPQSLVHRGQGGLYHGILIFRHYPPGRLFVLWQSIKTKAMEKLLYSGVNSTSISNMFNEDNKDIELTPSLSKLRTAVPCCCGWCCCCVVAAWLVTKSV